MCALFADYLVLKGKKVVVGDFDNQGSLVTLRKRDLEGAALEGTSTTVPYEILGYSLTLKGDHTGEDVQNHIKDCVDELKSKADIVLLDTPGHLGELSMLWLFHWVDVAITPFGYDRMSWESLRVYRNFLHLASTPRLNPDYGVFMSYFTLNKLDRRVGTAIEHELWMNMNKILSKEGVLTPSIRNTAALQRVSTMGIDKEQILAVEQCFDFLIRQIFQEII